MTEADHYKSLGLTPGATPLEIKNAYRRLARECHPDALQGLSPQEKASAEHTMRQVNAAWTTLSDPRRRAEYDRKQGYESHWSQRRNLIAAIRGAVSENDVHEIFRTAQDIYLHYPDDDRCSDLYAEACSALAWKLSSDDNLTAAQLRLRRAMDVAKDADLKHRAKTGLKALKSRSRRNKMNAGRAYLWSRLAAVRNYATGRRVATALPDRPPSNFSLPWDRARVWLSHNRGRLTGMLMVLSLILFAALWVMSSHALR